MRCTAQMRYYIAQNIIVHFICVEGHLQDFPSHSQIIKELYPCIGDQIIGFDHMRVRQSRTQYPGTNWFFAEHRRLKLKSAMGSEVRIFVVWDLDEIAHWAPDRRVPALPSCWASSSLP